MRKSKTTIAYIRWFDATQGHGGTFTAEEAHGLHEMESSGLLVKEDKQCITIALDRCLDTSGLRMTLCIPKINVRSVKKFQV